MRAEFKKLVDKLNELNIEKYYIEKKIKDGDGDLCYKRRIEDIDRERQEVELKIDKLNGDKNGSND